MRKLQVVAKGGQQVFVRPRRLHCPTWNVLRVRCTALSMRCVSQGEGKRLPFVLWQFVSILPRVDSLSLIVYVGGCDHLHHFDWGVRPYDIRHPVPADYGLSHRHSHHRIQCGQLGIHLWKGFTLSYLTLRRKCSKINKWRSKSLLFRTSLHIKFYNSPRPSNIKFRYFRELILN